jgi:hypothetical protein
MTTKEIKEKYGIEPIMKEMWVWDDDVRKARLEFVFCKDNCKDNPSYPYPYFAKSANFRYACETNPNYKEPKVGDKGYFWDDEESYLCSVIKNIFQDGRPPYYCSLGLWFTNFSKEKQPWMK